MNLSLLLFLIGILGFVLNRKNIILMLISIEIMLLAITFLILVSSLSFDDILGQTYAIYIIAIAGAESAIGLGILVAFYRFISSKTLYCKSYCRNSHSSSLRQSSISHCINKVRNYSTYSTKNSSLDPSFITGLLDAEGSFVVTILRNSRHTIGWSVQARIQIKMHEKDRALLELVQSFFGGIGYISKPNNRSTVEYRVSTLNDLVKVIIPHFENYPLLTKKFTDYVLFKQVVLLMLDKKHNTLEGLQEIVNCRASLNWGLPNNLKEAFPLVVPVKRLDVKNSVYKNISPKWVAGFATGESNFFIAVVKSKTKTGLATWLRFSIGQDSRDLLLLESIVNFFDCGYVTKYKQRTVCEFTVTKINDIVKHIIPFFEEHPIIGSKHLDYLNFKHAANIIKNKEHLDADGKGLEKILQLKSSMNKARDDNSEVGKEEM